MPDDLCPISLEVMEDPVIAADGHSYERSDIEVVVQPRQRHVAQDGRRAAHQFLTPNHNLRSAIQ